MGIFSILSFATWLCALFVWRQRRPSLAWKIFGTLFAGSLLLGLVAFEFADSFTGEGINESVLFYLRSGFKGAGISEYSNFIAAALGALILGSLLIAFTIWRSSKRSSRATPLIASLLLLLSAGTHPIFVSGFKGLSNSVVSSEEVAPPLSAYYRWPRVESVQRLKKNFVLIYAESLEATYLDPTIFPELMPRLSALKKEATFFSNIRQAPSTGWTIAGMVSTLCGVPLVTPSHGNSMSGVDAFLPTLKCLPDLLKDEGYALEFVGGADLNFAGKGAFLKTHGFDNTFGRHEIEAQRKGHEESSAWGVYDDEMFAFAKERLKTLSDTKENFGLALLTLDTHHPRGHRSPKCKVKYKEGSNEMLDALRCADVLISDFIEDLRNDPTFDDTVIVLASDHFAMRNLASPLLEQAERKNLLMVFSSDQKGSIASEGSTLDLSSTLLPVLGFKGEVGLGRDLNKTKSNVRFFDYIESWRPKLSEFWNFPQIKSSLTLTPTRGALVDGQSFKAPLLLRLNNQLQSKFYFEFDRSKSHKALAQHRADIAQDEGFVWIYECEKAHFCVRGGKGKDDLFDLPLEKPLAWSTHEVRAKLKLPHAREPKVRVLPRVAHAGGGIDGSTYTNSLRALDANYKRGFRFFELDFSTTSDGHLVCIHDWEASFERSFQQKAQGPVSLEAFDTLVRTSSTYNKCQLTTLLDWLAAHSDAFIVSDVKDDNKQALTMIAKQTPRNLKRFIPQIYEPDEAAFVEGLGFERYIWTLYRYKESNEKVLSEVTNMKRLWAVTMPIKRAKSNLPRRLIDQGISSYAHTINDADRLGELRFLFDVQDVYTDFLAP